MDDIHDIKNVLEIFQLNGYSLSYLIVAIAMVIIVRIIKKRKISRSKHKDMPPANDIPFDPELYLKKINELEKQIDILDTKKFYTRLKKIFLGYLEHVGYDKISKMSFEEIRRMKRPNTQMISLIQDIYYYGFDPKIEDSIKTRKLYINKVKKAITVK